MDETELKDVLEKMKTARPAQLKAIIDAATRNVDAWEQEVAAARGGKKKPGRKSARSGVLSERSPYAAE